MNRLSIEHSSSTIRTPTISTDDIVGLLRIFVKTNFEQGVLSFCGLFISIVRRVVRGGSPTVKKAPQLH